MQIAIYDNPLIGRRECWIDKRLHSFVNMELLFIKETLHPLAEKGFWIHPWKEGQLIGNRDAIAIHR